MFRQLVAFGYLAVDHDGFGALVLTDASKPVLKGEQNVTLRKYVKPTRTRQSSGRTGERADPTAGMSPREKARWERLRLWRAETAKCDGVPAYVIFHDATLAEMSPAGSKRWSGRVRATGWSGCAVRPPSRAPTRRCRAAAIC